TAAWSSRFSRNTRQRARRARWKLRPSCPAPRGNSLRTVMPQRSNDRVPAGFLFFGDTERRETPTQISHWDAELFFEQKNLCVFVADRLCVLCLLRVCRRSISDTLSRHASHRALLALAQQSGRAGGRLPPSFQ